MTKKMNTGAMIVFALLGASVFAIIVVGGGSNGVSGSSSSGNKLIALVTGRGEKKIDSSSDEKFKESIEAVKNSLSTERKKQFEEAVQVVAFSEIGNIFEAAANPDGMQRQIKDKLSGKTADEIIADGNRIISERKIKEREQAVSEIEETQKKIVALKQEQVDTEKAKESLKQFNVVRSRFYFQESFYRDEAVIELTIKNETEYAISRACFQGVLSSPGRSVPWVRGSFNYKISGGIEPGEQVTWKLSPNMFGEWSKAPKDRKDMVLTVTVTRIDGADEEPIFDSDFSEFDKERLDQLCQRLVELQKVLQN